MSDLGLTAKSYLKFPRVHSEYIMESEEDRDIRVYMQKLCVLTNNNSAMINPDLMQIVLIRVKNKLVINGIFDHSSHGFTGQNVA